MPRKKKEHLKKRKDGRYCCKYKGIAFYSYVSDEDALALSDRVESVMSERAQEEYEDLAGMTVEDEFISESEEADAADDYAGDDEE